MSFDILWNFYYSCVRSQYFAEHTFVSDPNHSLLLRTQLFRDLGNSLRDLLNAALPSSSRAPRNYRIKYIEDTDFGILEACLISVANRIVTDSEKEPNLGECLSIAREVMENFTALQVLTVSSVIQAERDLLETLKSGNSDLAEVDSLVNGYIISYLDRAAPLLVSNLAESTLNQGPQSNTPANFRIALNIMKKSIPKPPKFVYEESSLQVGECDDKNSPFVKHLTLSPTLLYHLEAMDQSLAQFEWSFVRYVSKKVRSRQEAEELQELTVLFSETLMWALAVGIVDPVALENRDPVILLCLPRLAILVGCRLLPQCPIGTETLFAGRRVPKVFHANLAELSLLTRQLSILSNQQWRILCVWLGPQGLSTSLSHLLSSSDQDQDSKVHKTVRELARQFNFPGLHWLYKKVSSLADSISAKHPAEVRFILQKAIEMNDPLESDEQPSTPAKKTELFFRDDLYRFLAGEFESDAEAKTCSSPWTSSGTPWWDFDWSSSVSLSSSCKKGCEIGIDLVALLDQLPSSSSCTTSGDILCHDGKLRDLLNKLLPDGATCLNQSSPMILDADQPTTTAVKEHRARWQPNQGGYKISQREDSSSESEAQEHDQEEEEPKMSIKTRLPEQGSSCARCFEGFTIFFRRHHCRRCGHIFCDPCSSVFRSLPGLSGQQRVCLDCDQFLGPA